MSDPSRIGPALERYRLAESDGHGPGTRKVTSLLSQIEQPIDLDRRYRQGKNSRQKNYSAHKRIHFPLFTPAALPEEEHPITLIRHLSGESEAAAESALLRQCEDVEDDDHQKVTQ